MNAKEKARPTAATVEQAMAETAKQAISCCNNITNKFETQCQIMGCIPIGADRPVTAKQLAELCSVQNERQITKRIEALRRAGVPVCASCDPANPGYFRAASPGELALYLHGLRGRMKEITATHNALERALNEWVGQVTMWGDDADG